MKLSLKVIDSNPVHTLADSGIWREKCQFLSPIGTLLGTLAIFFISQPTCFAESKSSDQSANYFKQLRSAKKSERDAAEKALGINGKVGPVSTQALLSAFKRARDLDLAMRLARILTRRKHRFTALSELPPVVVSELKIRCGKMAKEQRPGEFETAVENLMEFGHAAEPLLLPVLEDRRQANAIRAKTACVLARMGRTVGLPLLIRALSESQDQTSIIVRPYILSLGNPAAVSLANSGIHSSNPEVRQQATQLLGFMGIEPGSNSLESLFLKGISDNNAQVALASILALANYGQPSSFEPLLKMFLNGRINDRFKSHAAAIALARLSTSANISKLLDLAGSKNITHLESAAVALGLWSSPPPDVEPLQLSNAINARLCTLLGHGSTRVQKRALEALGNRINHGRIEPTQCLALLQALLKKGKIEVRYAAALALGETAAKGVSLSKDIEKRCVELFNGGKLESAAGSCKEALLSIFEKTGAGQVSLAMAPGESGSPNPQEAEQKPQPEKNGNDQDGKNETAQSKPGKVESKPEGTPGEGTQTESGDDPPPNPYREGFQWGNRSKPPVTEAKTPEPVQSGDTPTSTEVEKPTTSSPGPGTTNGNSESDPSKSDDSKPENPTPTGAGNRFGDIPPGLPGQRRHRMEAIYNPCKPGNLVYVGYLRVN